MKQGIGINQFYNTKLDVFEFTDNWLAFSGKPEKNSAWFIYGNSSNGKTVFASQLAKYLSTFSRVLYNSLEEGLSVSLRNAFKNAEITAKDKITVLDKEQIAILKERLRKPKSPKIIIIDSFQYSGLNAKSYKELRNEFNKHMFIFVSHADGRLPSGRSAKSAHFDADVKIWVEGYKAMPKSRYGGNTPHTIWQQEAEKYWINE